MVIYFSYNEKKKNNKIKIFFKNFSQHIDSKEKENKLSKNSNDTPKSHPDKNKEPSLDKLKKSDRVDKTDKPADQLKSEKSSRAISSSKHPEESTRYPGIFLRFLIFHFFFHLVA